MNDVPRLDKIVIWVAVILALLMLFCGCIGRDTHSEGKTTTRETVVTTPLANGGQIVERTTETLDQSDTKQTTQLDGTGALLAKLGGAAVGVATGTGGAVPWELIIGGAATAIAGGVGAMKATQAARAGARADQLAQERDFHKADADQAYKRLESGGRG